LIFSKGITDETAIITAVDGVLTLKDDLKDYSDRGDQLANFNVLEFSLNTYDGDELPNSDNTRGRPPNDRVSYLDNTGHGKRCRIIRTDGHESMPNVIGTWFPRNDVPKFYDFYCACMLALLRPWREIADLKHSNQTFEQAFNEFTSTADQSIMDIIANIQYPHECSDSAIKKRQQEEDKGGNHEIVSLDDIDKRFLVVDEVETDNPFGMQVMSFTQHDIDRQIAAEFSQDDRAYAEVVINIAMDHHIFEECPTVVGEWKKIVPPATMEQMVEYAELERLVKAVTKNRIGDDRREQIETQVLSIQSSMEEAPSVSEIPPADNVYKHINVLNKEQKCAHDIVASHLRATLAIRNPPQLLMIIMGPGGTGKSTLLNAITTTFEQHGAQHLLKKSAMSGIAASLIGGTTLHWLAGLPARAAPQSDNWTDSSGKEIRDCRVLNLVPASWIAIDESSMCTLDSLTLLSQVAGKVHVGEGVAMSTAPFGGLNVMLMGDFHQFPPVGNTNAALYSNPPVQNTAIVGKAIYLQFETVINLTQQWRITDFRWMEILENARQGECTREDIEEIRKLVIAKPGCEIPDFKHAPWDDVVLVTP